MPEYIRVNRRLIEKCFRFITESAIKDFKVGRHDDYAFARDILNQLIRVLDTE